MSDESVLKDAGFGSEDEYNEWAYGVIQATLKANEKWAKDCTRYYREVRGVHYDNALMDPGEAQSDNMDPQAVVNIMGAHVERYVALIHQNDMTVETEPLLPQYERHAKISQYLLNYFWKQSQAKRQMKKIARDGLTTGLGVAFIGWKKILDQTRNPKKQGKIVSPEYIKQDAPWVERIDPRLYIQDPEAPDHTCRTARWTGHVFYLPAYDLLTNSSYDKKVVDKIYDGTYHMQEYGTSYWGRQENNQKVVDLDPYNRQALRSSLLECYDFWDRKFDKHCQFTKGVPEPFFSEDWPYPHLEGHPYATWFFLERNDSRFPTGLPELIAQAQSQINRNRAQINEWRARCANVGMGVDKNRIPDVQTEQDLLDGKMGQFVLTDGPPSEVFEPITFSSAGLEACIRIDNVYMNDIYAEDGLSPSIEGEGVQPRVPATGVASQERFINLKIKDKMSNFDELKLEVVKQYDQHMKAYLQKPTAIRIDGPEGQDWMMQTAADGTEIPVEATAADIQGNYDVSISTSDLPDTDPQAKTNALVNVYQTSLQNIQALSQIQQGKGVPDFVELERTILESMNIKERNRIFPGIAQTPVAPSLPDQPQAGQQPQAAPNLVAGPQQAQQNAVTPGSEAQGPAGAQSGGY